MKPLQSAAIQKGLKTKFFGRTLLCLEKATSTNDVLLALAKEGGAEGTVVTAEAQTRGRGRQGRHWSSSAGKSLAFSILLWPNLPAGDLSGITLAAAVAVARTLEDFRVKPSIKWPNDLLLGGKKLCGILTEAGPRKGKMTAVILGIGINLSQGIKDFPPELRETATSFYLFSGKKIDRSLFLKELLFHLEETYHWVTGGRLAKVLAEWKKRTVTLGQQVKVNQGSKPFYGQAMDMDEQGALLVRNDLGMVERVISGDVEVLVPRKRRGI